MSDSESEQSLNEELQHNDEEEEVYETVIKKGLDRKTNKTVKVKKERTPAQKEATEKMLKARMAKKALKENPDSVIEEKVDNEILESVSNEIIEKKNISQSRLKNLQKAKLAIKTKGDIVKTNVEKIKRQIKKEMPIKTKEIYKEKIIYMVDCGNGNYLECDSKPKLTKKELQKIENEEGVSKKEIELGKKLIRKKNGTADNRSKPRTEKQIAANKKLGELSKQRNLKKKEDKKSELNTQIKSALIDVVSRPIEQTKKEIEKPKYDFSIIKI